MPRSTPSGPSRFDRIYTENLGAILGYAARRCPQPGDAADVAAEVFLVAWRRLDDVPVGEERVWLFGTARRVLANHRRGQRRRSDLADRLRDELRTRPVTVVADVDTLAVTQALATLSDGDREILTLAVWDGLTPAEIAAVEQIPAATVRSRLFRARARLREVLDDPAAPVTAQRTARGGHVPAVTRSHSRPVRNPT